VVSSSFLWGKLLRSVLRLFHQAFMQCVQTGTDSLVSIVKEETIRFSSVLARVAAGRCVGCDREG